MWTQCLGRVAVKREIMIYKACWNFRGFVFPPPLSLPFLSSFVSELSQRILFFFFVYVFHNLNYKRKYFVTVIFTLMIKWVRRNRVNDPFFRKLLLAPFSKSFFKTCSNNLFLLLFFCFCECYIKLLADLAIDLFRGIQRITTSYLYITSYKRLVSRGHPSKYRSRPT